MDIMGYKHLEGTEFEVRNQKIELVEVIDSGNKVKEDLSPGIPVFKLRVYHTNECNYTFYINEEASYIDGEVKSDKEVIEYLEVEMKDKVGSIYNASRDDKTVTISMRHLNDGNKQGVEIKVTDKFVNGIAQGQGVTLLEDTNSTYNDFNRTQATLIPEIIRIAHEAGKQGEDLSIVVVPDSKIF